MSTRPADQTKTKAQLLAELNELRQRVAQLEAAERPSAETGLPTYENWFRLIFETTPQGIWQVDPQGIILSANQSLVRMLGYTGAELVGCPLFDFVAESDLAQHRAVFDNRQRGQAEQVELRFRRKDGSDLWVLLSTIPVMLDSEEFLFGVAMFTDITERKWMEQVWRESEARFQAVLANNSLVVFDQDCELRYTHIYNPNPNFTVEGIIGKTDADLFLPPDAARLIEIKSRVLTTGISERQEVQATLGGQTFYYDMTVESKYDSAGQIVGVACAAMDITERKQAEAALAESEQKYRQLFSEMSNGCALHEIICDSDGRPMDYITLEVNHAYEVFLNVKSEDVMGKKASEILPAAELNHWLKIFGPVALTGKSTHYEMYSPFNQKHFEGSAYCPDKGFFAITFTDTTERRRLEAALQESRERLEMALQGANLGTWDWQRPSDRMIYDQRWADLLGYTLAELEPHIRTWETLIHPDDLAPAWAGANAHLAGYTPIYQNEHQLRCKSGAWKWVLSTGRVCERDEQGQPTRLVGILQDITARKQAELTLAESEARYRSLFQNNLDAVVLSTPDGRILDTNPAACAMYDYTVAEFRQLGRADVVDTTDPRLPLAMEERARTGKFVGELTHLRRDGTPFPVEVSSVVFPDQNGELKTYVIARDITERKQAEEALRASEARFKTIFQASPLPISITRFKDQHLMDINPAWETHFGFSREEALGRTALELNLQTDPGDRQRLLKQLQEQGNVRGFEVQTQSKSGVVRDVLASAELIDIGGEPGLLILGQDITERKRTEEALRASEQKFRQIIEKSGDGFVLTDHTGQVIEWNRMTEQITGLPRTEIVGRTSWEVQFALLPVERRTPATLERLRTFTQAYLQTGQDPLLNQMFEFELQRSDGSYRDIQEVDFPLKTEAGFWRGSIIRDVTERKQAERIETAQLAVSQILAQSPEPEAALRQILEAIAVGLGWQLAHLWRLDSSGSRLVWQGRWCTPDQPELLSFAQARPGVYL